MTALSKLIAYYQQGDFPVFSAGPLIFIEQISSKGLQFNQMLQDPDEMARAAVSNLELGFEATVLPFDMNIEAEIIGCPVLFHKEAEGMPVYPTVGERWIESADDFELPESVAQTGRLPVITSAIRQVKAKAAAQAAVGAFLPGPFTLAGQIMDPDRMFVKVLKKPKVMQAVLDKLSQLLSLVRDVYTQAGADYIIVEEGGATSISPKAFGTMVLPAINSLLQGKSVPHILSLAGHSERYLPLLLETGADGFGIDQQCDLKQALQSLPDGFPLLATCGTYDMLANSTPEGVQNAVCSCLDTGITQACPPADIYPPAKLENIKAFIEAHKFYKQLC